MTPIRPIALALAATLAAGPVAADRDRGRDNVLAGALILGIVGLAIAEARQEEHGSQRQGIAPLPEGRITRQLTGDLGGQVQGQVRSTGQITAPIHITPERPLYTGPGGVPPGTRSDPLAVLGPLTATTIKPETAPQIGSRIEPLFGTGGTGGFVPDPVTTPWVETRTLAPTGQPPAPAYPVAAPVTRPLPTGGTGPLIPAQCLQTFDRNGENLSLYGPACLAATTPFAADLPISCAVTLQTLGRFVSGYDPACLNAAGYSLARG